MGKITELKQKALVQSQDHRQVISDQLAQLTMIMQQLPDSISETLAEDWKALDMMQERLDQITQAQLSTMTATMAEITKQMESAAAAQLDLLSRKKGEMDETLAEMQEQSRILTEQTSEMTDQNRGLRIALHGAKLRNGGVKPGLRTMIEDLDETNSAGKITVLKTAVITALVTALLMTMAMAVMPKIWNLL